MPLSDYGLKLHPFIYIYCITGGTHVSTYDHHYFEQITLVYDILHTPNSLRCFDLHGIGGVRVGAQGEAGIGVARHAGEHAIETEPEERNRFSPGGSFPLVNKLLDGVVSLSRSYDTCPRSCLHFSS